MMQLTTRYASTGESREKPLWIDAQKVVAVTRSLSGEMTSVFVLGREQPFYVTESVDTVVRMLR